MGQKCRKDEGVDVPVVQGMIIYVAAYLGGFLLKVRYFSPFSF